METKNDGPFKKYHFSPKEKQFKPKKTPPQKKKQGKSLY